MKTLLQITSIILVCLGINNASAQYKQYTNENGTSNHGFIPGAQTSAPATGGSSSTAKTQAMIEGYRQQSADRAAAQQQSIQQSQANMLNTISQWQAPSQQRTAEQQSESDYGSRTQTRQWADESSTTYTPEPSAQRIAPPALTTTPKKNSTAARAEEDRARQQEDLEKWQKKQEAILNGDDDNGYPKSQKQELFEKLNTDNSGNGDANAKSASDLAWESEAAAMREQQRREWIRTTEAISKKKAWGDLRRAQEEYDASTEGFAEKILKLPASQSSRPTPLPDGSISTLQEKTRRDDNQWLQDIKSKKAKY